MALLAQHDPRPTPVSARSAGSRLSMDESATVLWAAFRGLSPLPLAPTPMLADGPAVEGLAETIHDIRKENCGELLQEEGDARICVPVGMNEMTIEVLQWKS